MGKTSSAEGVGGVFLFAGRVPFLLGQRAYRSPYDGLATFVQISKADVWPLFGFSAEGYSGRIGDMISVSLLLFIAVQIEPAPDQASTPTPPKEKLICRREVPVGSLIASRKMCLTKTQWEQRAEVGNAVARRMVNENMGNMNVQ